MLKSVIGCGDVLFYAYLPPPSIPAHQPAPPPKPVNTERPGCIMRLQVNNLTIYIWHKCYAWNYYRVKDIYSYYSHNYVLTRIVNSLQ